MRYVLVCCIVAIVAIVAACSYGSYDGSYDGGVDAGPADRATGTVVLVQTVEGTREETLVARDGVIEVTFPGGAFAAPTPVTITRIGERKVDALIVPIYSITAAAALQLPMQVLLRGDTPNAGGTSRVLLVAQRSTDGSFAPTPITSVGGGGGGGPNNAYWGLARELGVFSLVFETLQQANGFADVSGASCFGKCCAASGGTISGQNGVLTSTGIACAGPPNASCFVTTCPDFAPAIARANDLAKHNSSFGGPCRPYAAIGAQNCPGPECSGYGNGNCNTGTGPSVSVCCILNRTGQCIGAGMGSSQCSGIAIRCDLDTACPNGTKCCAFDTDTYCTATCPNKRTLCKVDAGCDGVACQDAPACPFRTCGPPPPACQY